MAPAPSSWAPGVQPPAPTRSSWLLRASFLAIVAALLAAPAKKYFAGGVNPYSPDLRGKVMLVTGANTGIGYETARELVRLNATVIFAGRDDTRIGDAVRRVQALYPSSASRAVPMRLDLADLASVRAFAGQVRAKFDRLDVLVNNAGVMIPPLTRTADDFELQIGTNHFGHFLLTELLTPLLADTAKMTGDARILAVASLAHRQGTIDVDDINWRARSYSRMGAYAQSKLANIVHASELSRRLEGTGVTAYSLHPGVVTTELTRHVPFAEILIPVAAPVTSIFFKDSWEGAQTQLYLAVAPKEVVAPHSGRYFSDCAATAPLNSEAFDPAVGRELWSLSRKAVGLADA